MPHTRVLLGQPILTLPIWRSAPSTAACVNAHQLQPNRRRLSPASGSQGRVPSCGSGSGRAQLPRRHPSSAPPGSATRGPCHGSPACACCPGFQRSGPPDPSLPASLPPSWYLVSGERPSSPQRPSQLMGVLHSPIDNKTKATPYNTTSCLEPDLSPSLCLCHSGPRPPCSVIFNDGRLSLICARVC